MLDPFARSLCSQGAINSKARALALCDVVGGPEYDMPLIAESASISYKLDKTSIDFGLQLYDRIEERELFLSNTGRVVLSFAVLKASLSRINVLEILPVSGHQNTLEIGTF